jgi:hypothetical protein
MKRISRLLFLTALTAVFIGSQFASISAQSNAISITPRKDYALQPGEAVSDTLNITNRDTQNPLQLKLTVVDFEAQDESGTPNLLESDVQKTPWSLRDYVNLPEQVNIDAGATARIPISIEIPADAGAGSYYSAIEYAAINDEQENRLNISASTVTLMFVKVPGQARQQLTFEQFGAYVPDSSGTNGSFSGLYFGERPKVMAYRLKNDGNVAEQPNASIVVKEFSGKIIYTITDANPKDQIALRGQTRRFEACIAPETIQQSTESGNEFDAVVCGDTNFKPGRYSAELTILYGENGNETREINAVATFWYLPWWFIGVIVAGLAIVAGIIFYIIRRFQSYRSRKTRRR